MSNPHDMSRAVNLLQALVRINTCQPAGNESVVVDFLESQFAPFEDVVWKPVSYTHLVNLLRCLKVMD